MAGKVYTGDVGTVVLLDSQSDITAMTTTQIRYKKPDGTIGTWTASITATTKLTYTTTVGDWDQAGTWTFWIYVAGAGGIIFHGEPVTYNIDAPLG